MVSQLGDLTALKKLSTTWVEDPTRKAPGVGLYIQMHATSGGYWGVVPKQLAGFVSMLYRQHGLRFRKINLSACFTGGPNKTDPSQSLAMVFCRELSTELGDHPEWLKGVMVAAYRATVTFEAEKDEDTGKAEIHNVVNNKPINPAVGRKDIQDTALTTLADLTKMAKDTIPKRMEVAIYRATSKDAGFKKLYEQVKNYISVKIAWKFDGQDWQRISLADYTDREDITEMIKQLHTIHAGSKVDAGTREKLSKWGFVL